LDLHGSFGRQVFDEGLGEFVVGGTVLVGHGGDLARDAVTERVHAGAFGAFFRFWTLTRSASRSFSIAGIRPDRFIGLGVRTIGIELFVGDHDFSRLRATTAGREIVCVRER